MGVGEQRFQLHTYFQGPSSAPQMFLLDTELGETWEFDTTVHQWRLIPVQLTNASPAASVQVTHLLQLLERGLQLIDGLQTGYSVTHQDTDQFTADCRAAGVNVP